MTRTALAVSTLLLVTSLAFADPPPAPPPGEAGARPSPATQPAAASQPEGDKLVAGLIERLGHKDFDARELATRKLIEMGPSVHPVLKAKLKEKDLDPEVAARIKTVLNKTGAGSGEGTTVTDEATGITVAVGADDMIEARKESGVLWKARVPQPPALGQPKSVKIENGVVIVLYGNSFSANIDLQTGRVLSIRRLRAPMSD